MISMLAGIPVTLLTASVHEGSKTWTSETVENVLVAPYAETDGTRAFQANGHQTVYHIAIPKTDAHSWEGALVQFFGCTWAVVGGTTQGIDELVPGPWNKKAIVELYRTAAPDAAGLWTDKVALLPDDSTQNAGGYRQKGQGLGREATVIFNKGVDFTAESRDGKSQLRQSASAELWTGDYRNERRLRYGGTLYEIRSAENTGRGTLMLKLEEVWR